MWRRVSAIMAGFALLAIGAVGSPMGAAAEPTGVPVGPGEAGEAIAFGNADDGRLDVPALPSGLAYTAAAAGVRHTVLLRSDGEALAFGDDTYGQTDVPPLPTGMQYTAVAAGTYTTVLLRSDGEAFILGMDILGNGATTVPPLPSGVTYTGVAAGAWHTALLRSDGEVVAFGLADSGRTDVPPLPAGLSYTQVAAGYNNTVLLRSDGQALVLGVDVMGSTVVPALPTGVVYTGIAAGTYHTVLLRSDGVAVAFGYSGYGQTTIPPLPTGETYTAVAAGQWNTILLRSDGAAIIVGDNTDGASTVPALPSGMRYTAAAGGERHTVLIRAEEAAPTATSASLTGPATASAGDLVSYTATVSPATPGPAVTGTVRFTFEDASTLDAAVAADGTATTTRTLPAGGAYTAVASYLGSSDYLASPPSNVVTTTVPYLVTFDSGPGASAVPPAAVAPGGLVPHPADPTRAGYAFDGWRTGDANGAAWDFAADTVTADLTLYAAWQEAATPTPQLTLSRATAAPGDTVTVQGTGFMPGQTVTLTLNPTLGTVVPDATGAFAFVFTMPAVTPGAHAVSAHVGDASDPIVASAAITVTAAAASPGLAATGAGDMTLALAGAALLLALGASVLASRARASKEKWWI